MTKPLIITTTSAKGGVGKTALAINIAFELAKEMRGRNVLLVDCDVFNYGATTWLAPLTINANHLSLSLSDLLSIWDSKKGILLHPPVFDALPVTDDETGIGFLFLPYYSSREKQVADALRRPGKSKMLDLYSSPVTAFSDFLLACISGMGTRPDIVIFDCHPSPIPITCAACSLASVNLMIADSSKETCFASILMTWHIDGKNCNLDSRNWHFILNHIDDLDLSAHLSKEVAASVSEAAKIRDQIKSNMPELNIPRLNTDFHRVLLHIPHFEEFRVALLRNDPQVLSTARRGGNGFFILVRKMLRQLYLNNELVGVTGNLFLPDAALDAAFTKVDKIYFTTRGVRKSGISRPLIGLALLLSGLVIATAGSMSYYPKITTVLEMCTLILCAGATLYFLSLVEISRECYEVFRIVSGFNPDDNRLKDFYHLGGFAGATNATWWPRLALFLPFFLLLALITVFRMDLWLDLWYFAANYPKLFGGITVVFAGLAAFLLKLFPKEIRGCVLRVLKLLGHIFYSARWLSKKKGMYH